MIQALLYGYATGWLRRVYGIMP